jgi:hypothetical protein
MGSAGTPVPSIKWAIEGLDGVATLAEWLSLLRRVGEQAFTPHSKQKHLATGTDRRYSTRQCGVLLRGVRDG